MLGESCPEREAIKLEDAASIEVEFCRFRPADFPAPTDPLASVARGDERVRNTPAPAESLERIAALLSEGMVVLERIATALERISIRD
jgi:hypothetical protein